VDLLPFLPVDKLGVTLETLDFFLDFVVVALVDGVVVSSTSRSSSSDSSSDSSSSSALSLSGNEEEQEEANVLV
jgi:hypothetical protein